MRMCPIPGCGKPSQRQKKKNFKNPNKVVKDKGLCGNHAWRLHKYGDANHPLLRRAPGTGSVDPEGYVMMQVDYVIRPQHCLIAEAALGRKLTGTEEVHHVDFNKHNNARSNLVICPDKSYHRLLHIRTKALDACGDPTWRKCNVCKEYDDPKNLYVHPKVVYHRVCQSEYERTGKRLFVR